MSRFFQHFFQILPILLYHLLYYLISFHVMPELDCGNFTQIANNPIIIFLTHRFLFPEFCLKSDSEVFKAIVVDGLAGQIFYSLLKDVLSFVWIRKNLRRSSFWLNSSFLKLFIYFLNSMRAYFELVPFVFWYWH